MLSASMTLILLAGLGIAAWLNGGEIFNPGALSAKTRPGITIQNFTSHAEFESQCGLCHQPLRSEGQSTLCKDCHTDITDQIAAASGTHGRMKDVDKCSVCHSDHKGNEFDPAKAALTTFNHNMTHFPLTNQHAMAKCEDCHKQANFSSVSTECSTCHKEPVIHLGILGQDCASCHGTDNWKNAKMDGQVFDHQKTNFSLAKHILDYNGQVMNCTACHDRPLKPVNNQKCIDCHNGHPAKKTPIEQTVKAVANPNDFLARHIEAYGSNCAQCHDGADRMSNFDHNQIFPLSGKHAGLDCQKCHADKKYDPVVRSCSARPEEPTTPAGFFGHKCEYCHKADGWRPALLIAHNFPLDHGGKGESDCKTCHTGAYDQNTCYGCHDHQADKIKISHAKVVLPKGVTLEQCVACHLDGKVKK